MKFHSSHLPVKLESSLRFRFCMKILILTVYSLLVSVMEISRRFAQPVLHLVEKFEEKL